MASDATAILSSVAFGQTCVITMSDSEDTKSSLEHLIERHTAIPNETAGSSSVSIEWTAKKCLHLIREYRERPILWDPRDKLYFKNNLKPFAWEEISQSVGVSAEMCKSKMVILLSSFRREKAKIISGKDGVYTSTWFAFNDLAFLMDKDVAHKRRIRGEDLGNTQEYSVNIHAKKRRKIFNASDIPSHTVKSEIEIVNAYTETQPSSSTRLIEQPTPSVVPPADDDEETKSFITFIANKMKKYSNQTKNAVQQAICDIIFKADQHYYDKTLRTFKCYQEKPRQSSSTSSNTDPLSH